MRAATSYAMLKSVEPARRVGFWGGAEGEVPPLGDATGPPPSLKTPRRRRSRSVTPDADADYERAGPDTDDADAEAGKAHAYRVRREEDGEASPECIKSERSELLSEGDGSPFSSRRSDGDGYTPFSSHRDSLDSMVWSVHGELSEGKLAAHNASSAGRGTGGFHAPGGGGGGGGGPLAPMQVPVSAHQMPASAVPRASEPIFEKMRFLVDFGSLGGGDRRLAIAAPRGTTIAQLRALAQERARSKWRALAPSEAATVDDAAGAEIVELMAAGGYALDDDDDAAEVILKNEAVFARWSWDDDAAASRAGGAAGVMGSSAKVSGAAAGTLGEQSTPNVYPVGRTVDEAQMDAASASIPARATRASAWSSSSASACSVGSTCSES